MDPLTAVLLSFISVLHLSAFVKYCSEYVTTSSLLGTDQGECRRLLAPYDAYVDGFFIYSSESGANSDDSVTYRNGLETQFDEFVT